MRAYEQEAALVARLAPSSGYGKRGVVVAELGCGTGCLTRALAAESAFSQVIGLDRERESLAVAASYRARTSKIMYVEHDVLEGWDGVQVDVAVAPFSLVYNFYPRQSLMAFFRSARSLIRRYGLLLLNGFNLQWSLRAYPSSRYHKFYVDHLIGWQRTAFHRLIVSDEGVANLHFGQRPEGGADMVHTQFHLRPYSPGRLTAVAGSLGFSFQSIVSSPKGTPFSVESSREYMLALRKV
jgi:predicted RNA methylase